MKRTCHRISLNVYDEDIAEFDRIADERRINRTSLIREAMMRTINEHKKEKGE